MFENTKAFSGFSADDIPRAQQFYGETLGLKVTEANGLLTLHIAGDRPTIVYPKPDHTPAAFTILNFPVDDIDAAVDALAARGVEFERYDGMEQDERASCAPAGRTSRGSGIRPATSSRCSRSAEGSAVVTVDDVRSFVAQLPRSYEVLVRDRIKFRVGQIVYVAFSRDETLMGFAFPKEEREALVASEPEKFMMPTAATCASSGSSSGWRPSTSRRCASSSSTPGGWSCPRSSPPPTTSASSPASCSRRAARRCASTAARSPACRARGCRWGPARP